MRTLITGSRGFFGSVLQQVLTENGHLVQGWDSGYFDPAAGAVRRDIRDVCADDLAGVDAIVHLAALCNDACGELSAAVTHDINEAASVLLARVAREAGVRKFVFASSCSVYGAAGDAGLNEDGPLAPLTAYARSKVDAEIMIRAMASPGFSPVALRFATLYGHSPSFRSDIMLNRMTVTAWRTNTVYVNGKGSAARPLLHVRDASRAVLAALSADAEEVSGQVFNVGAPGQNYRVIDVARTVARHFPGTRLEHVGSGDKRTYGVDFGKFLSVFGNSHVRCDLADGVREVHEALRDGIPDITLGTDHWGRSDRKSWLQHLRAQAELSEDFRWTSDVVAAV